MKRLCTVLTVLMLMLVFLSMNAWALNTNFEIKNYDVRMNVRDDNSYEITETLDVHFNVQRHGIIRNIPLKTYRGDWARITDVKVLGHSYKKTKEDGELKIQIGDPDKYANENEKYVISYVYNKGGDGIDSMDELYFNLIGLDWDVYIRNVTFNITMPFGFDQSKLNFTYGKKGSTDNSEVEYSVNGTTIAGRLNRELGPNEALTVALPLPEGYYVNAEEEVTLGTYIQNNYEIIFLAAVLAAILLWGLLGRSRRIFPTVEFYPPQGLTSADLGFIYDGEANPQDITSLIIYWADRGYLQIQEYVKDPAKRKKTELVLCKLRDMGPEAKEYEQKMFHNLFNLYGDGKFVYVNSLKKRFYGTVDMVKNMLRGIWNGSRETRIYSKSSKLLKLFVRLFCLITATAVCYGIYYSMNQGTFDEMISPSLLFGVAMSIPVWMVCGLAVKWKQMLPRHRAKMVLKRGFWLVVTAGAAYYFTPGGLHLMTITGYIACFAISLLAEKCIKRTKVGDSYMEKILGFRDFILYAEKDRINIMVEENPGYYFNVLPFAMVLGVTDKWARKFEGITLQPPEWYRPYYQDRYYDSLAYASLLTESVHEMAEAMSSAPASSGSSSSGGSSDGGSSGGGDGGGGGDDW